MKFDACPVEPPGFGSGPLSINTMSVQPSLARWPTRQLPTIPAPMITHLAVVGTVPVGVVVSLMFSQFPIERSVSDTKRSAI